jgi:hypothetical protein
MLNLKDKFHNLKEYLLHIDIERVVFRTLIPFALFALLWSIIEKVALLKLNSFIKGIDIQNEVFSIILFVSVLVLSLIFIVIRICKGRLRVAPLFLLLLCYIVAIIIKHYDLWNSGIKCWFVVAIIIYLATIVLFSFGTNFVEIISYKKISNDKSLYFPDKPIEKGSDDLLEYDVDAKAFADSLKGIDTTKTSYSIGLIAAWGVGKTSYMNLLKNHIDDNSDDFITVRFNPRHSASVQEIQKDFFEQLYYALKEEGANISAHSFREYMAAIDLLANNRFISTFVQLFPIRNRESLKERIEKGIARMNKKVVVLIDDFDRLLADEIIEVLKLIDGNASFKNLIFISAYDKSIVNRSIEESKFCDKGMSFIDKFFTIEKYLPIRPYYGYTYKYLKNQLREELRTDKWEEYSAILDGIDNNLLSQYLSTLRDVKRFINLFTLPFLLVEGEVEFKDFFLLYLIKCKYLDEYLLLYSDKEQLNISHSGGTFVYSEKDSINSGRILSMLFPKRQSNEFSPPKEPSLTLICQPLVYNTYFFEQVYDRPRMDEMRCLFDSSLKDMQSFIDEQHSPILSFKFLSDYLRGKDLYTFPNKQEFERYIDILLYIHCKGYDMNSSYYYLICKFINNNSKLKKLKKRYSYSDSGYKDMMQEKLKGKYPNYPNGITRGVQIDILKSNAFEDTEENKDKHVMGIHEELPHIIFTQKELLEISKEALNECIEKEPIITKRHTELLRSCIDHIRIHNVILDRDCCAIVKKQILKEPSGFLSKDFIGLGMHSSNPEDNTIACEVEWKQIFDNDNKNFEELIMQSNIELLKNFWSLYENNNYEPIPFENDGDVQEKIRNSLVRERKLLEQILNVEEQFEELKEKMKNQLNNADISSCLGTCRDMLSQLQDNKLWIAKKGAIIKEMEEYIQQLSGNVT